MKRKKIDSLLSQENVKIYRDDFSFFAEKKKTGERERKNVSPFFTELTKSRKIKSDTHKYVNNQKRLRTCKKGSGREGKKSKAKDQTILLSYSSPLLCRNPLFSPTQSTKQKQKRRR